MPLVLSKRVCFAHFRFSVVGPLLAAPPGVGELEKQLEELVAKKWRHPVTEQPVQFSFPTLEVCADLQHLDDVADEAKSAAGEGERAHGHQKRHEAISSTVTPSNPRAKKSAVATSEIRCRVAFFLLSLTCPIVRAILCEYLGENYTRYKNHFRYFYTEYNFLHCRFIPKRY